MSRIKNDGYFPYYILNQIKDLNIKIDKVIATGYNTFDAHPIYGYMKKIGLINSVYDDAFHYYKSHHYTHAVRAFFASKMQKALVVVADGRGSNYILDNGEQAFETISVYDCAFYPRENRVLFFTKYKKLVTTRLGHNAKVKPHEVYGFDFKSRVVSVDDGTKFDVDHRPSAGAFYSRITKHLGFEVNDEGKLMGLQSYGKPNKDLEKILSDDDLFFYKDKYSRNINFALNTEKYPEIFLSQKNRF